MLSYIISHLIYYDQLFLNDSVFFTLHLYHLNLLFTSRYFRLSFLLCTIFIQFFRPLIWCPLTSFWLSYSVSQSDYQSSRFFYPFILSLSLSLLPKRFLLVCHTPFLTPFLYQYLHKTNSLSCYFSRTSMSLYISYILSHFVSVSFVCILLFFNYLSLHSLSLCNSNSFFVSTIAPLQSARCPNAIQLRQYFSAILMLRHSLSLPLSLTFSSSRSLSLSLLFHQFNLTLSLCYSQFR